MPRWASDVTVLRLNTGITVYRGKPTVQHATQTAVNKLKSESLRILHFILCKQSCLIHCEGKLPCLRHTLGNRPHGTEVAKCESKILSVTVCVCCIFEEEYVSCRCTWVEGFGWRRRSGSSYNGRRETQNSPKTWQVMIWGTETLKNRSVTGVATKKKKDALPKPPLSPSKLKIVRGKRTIFKRFVIRIRLGYISVFFW